MAQYMQGQKTCLDTFPLEKEMCGWKPTSGEDVLLVDVCGNVGPLLDELKAKTAGIENRIMNFPKTAPCDLGKTSDAILMQLRRILLFKSRCMTLTPLSPSKLNEKIFPDPNVNWQMTQIDISMMACSASLERTEAMWGAFRDSVGLNVVRKYFYQPEFCDGVLVAERK
ncbi:uncharacterized protein EAE98_010821 [Botrytis deweyae]|uniref:O-methyltransferase domain-containing protein n=1 Tax=Botrytis deweyae TaxID=2478750 RepID=A0ABQ7I840_9HELO|nr:uncharacterized protein EAE98_010821 [Botrytis deweyae]KAF7916236.1 hypothetical protein EAE98_010821 [Botrytis deweyae]